MDLRIGVIQHTLLHAKLKTKGPAGMVEQPNLAQVETNAAERSYLSAIAETFAFRCLLWGCEDDCLYVQNAYLPCCLPCLVVAAAS